MLIYAAAVTLVISLAGWIGYAIVAFFVLAPFAVGFGLADPTANIVFGGVLLPLPALLSIWIFRRVTAVERHRTANTATNVANPDAAADADADAAP